MNLVRPKDRPRLSLAVALWVLLLAAVWGLQALRSESKQANIENELNLLYERFK